MNLFQFATALFTAMVTLARGQDIDSQVGIADNSLLADGIANMPPDHASDLSAVKTVRDQTISTVTESQAFVWAIKLWLSIAIAFTIFFAVRFVATAGNARDPLLYTKMSVAN